MGESEGGEGMERRRKLKEEGLVRKDRMKSEEEEEE